MSRCAAPIGPIGQNETLMPPSMWWAEPGAVQHRRQHDRVDVGAVARQQRDRVPAVQVLERTHLVGVDLDATAVRGAVEQPGDVEEHVTRGPAVGRDHLLQVGVELLGDVVDRPARRLRELVDASRTAGRPRIAARTSCGAFGHCTGQFASVSR